MKRIEELVEITEETLEPNISFANGGYGDNVHHKIDPSFTGLMGYLVVYIIMPILTGCVGSILHDLIKVRGGNRVRLGVLKGYMHVVGTKEFIDDNVITTDEIVEIQSKATSDDDQLAHATIDDSKATEAEAALSQFLVSNGWPTKIAEMNAKRIVTRIIEVSH